MPTYLYIAKNKKGQDKTGTLEAVTEQELSATLRKEGLVLISSEIAGAKEKVNYFNPKNLIQIINRISLVDKMMFSKHLAVMIKAGLSLNQALKILTEQTKNSKFKRIISEIEQNVRQGESFSDSLKKYPKVFDNLYVNMILVGETSGNLNKVLDILAEQMKKDHELLSRVKGAMIYPSVIIVAMIGIGILMMIMVVPKLTSVFSELGVNLPLSTRIIMGISNFLKNNYIICLIVFVVLIFLIMASLKEKKVQRILHKIYLYLPIVSSLTQKVNSARFAGTFSSLSESGVPIVKSLKIIAGTLGNIHFREALLDASEQVQKGKELSKAMAKYKHLYTPMVIQMIGVGEKTGSMSDILKNLADFYHEEIDNTTKNMSAIIEPLIMIVIGAAVAIFAISMIQPMYSMMDVI
ncbi:MAG: type II secretion system F family protein [bacterium]